MARKAYDREQSRSTNTPGRSLNRGWLLGIVLVIGCVCLGCFIVLGASLSDPFSRILELPSPDPGSPEAVGSGGDWWQVYFTEPEEERDIGDLAGSIPGELIELINGAQDSIHIAVFEINLAPIVDALIAAQRRGVEVQLVTDDEHGIEADEDDGNGFFAAMEAAGIEVKDDQRSALMHNKFLIFDESIVWTGSTNLTVNGNYRNNNNVLVIHDPGVAEIYEREFAEMWDGEHGPTSPSLASEQTVSIGDSTVQILFAAEDDVVEQLISLIQNASSSLRFMAFSFTHDGLGGAMLDRAGDGIEVQGIFETRGSETEFSELTPLYCSGLPVRQDGNPGTMHHKVLIIDERIVVTGSLNFSNNADESNDENVLIVANEDIASQYIAEFERRWLEAVEPDLNCR